MSEIINTKRLVLKPYCDSDQDAMVEILTNEQIKKTFMIPDFKDEDEVIKMFMRLKGFSHSDEHYERGIYVNEELIGFINDVEIDGDRIELGYVIHPRNQNKGYATEALGAAIENLFQKGYNKIITGAFKNNTASIRVMEKCGMVRIEKEEDIIYRNEKKHCCYYESIACTYR